MKIRKFVPLTGLVLAASLGLAGCAPSEAPAPDTTATAPVVQTPEVGGTVDAAQAEGLNGGAVPGLRAYAMQDGTFLVVSETEPLPEAVLADMEARVAAVPLATDTASSAEVDAQLSGFVFDAREQTGKDIVVLTYSWYPIGVDVDAPTQERWVHMGDVEGVTDPMGDITIRTREEYRAMLDAAQANDPNIVIIEHG